jgi:SAM-dependent methyltransferase
MEQRYYEEYARVQSVHWWFAGRRRILGSLLEYGLPVAGGERRVLDVGCGTGANLDELGRFGRVEGVEAEPAAVEYCRSRGGWNVTQASGDELPFEAASFDLVTLLDVIEHVPDDATILAEARRVLRPGGSVLITVPAYTWMWGAQDEISHHYRRYTAGRLRSSLNAAGLLPERTTYFNTLLFPPIAAIRLLRRVRPQRGELSSDFELTEPGPLNSLLARLFGLEASILRRANLPFGVSVAALARVGSR